MGTVELKNSEWKEFSKADYAIIDCYGDNCSACVMLAPVYDALADELSAIAFGRINITQYYEIAEQFGVDAMPTLLYFRKGEMHHQSIGSLDRNELLAEISKLLYE